MNLLPVLGRRPSGQTSAGLLGLSVLVLLSCDRAPERLGWQRIDLCLRPPKVQNLGTAPRSLAAQPDLFPLGEGPRKRRTGDERLASLVQGLAASTDVLLQWDVQLGQQPFLVFRPLSRSQPGCELDYLIGVRTADSAITELHREAIPPEDPPTPAARDQVSVDLAPYAGQSVTVVASAQARGQGCGPEPPQVVWASLAVYSRVKTHPGPRNKERPNLLLIGLDTVRADALGFYGRDPSPSPAMDALAAESDVWLQAFSSFNVTNPSFASILTGLYGKNHGVYDLVTPLPDAHLTLAEVLQAAGYETAAVLSARHLGHKQSGLGQGFAEYFTPSGQLSAETAVDTAIAWLGNRRESPFFLWLHLFDPHTPHTPPDPFALGYRPAEPPGVLPVTQWTPFRTPRRVAYSHPVLGGHRDLYVSEVAYTDQQLGRLLEFLRSRRLLDHTLLVLVADHGENLGENQVFFRHSGLWDTTTHVPLLIRWPGLRSAAPRRFPQLVQTLDLFPTVLRALGLPPLPGDGQILAGVPGSPDQNRRLVFAEHSAKTGAMVRTEDFLYMKLERHLFLASGAYLYDLRQDPQQQHNLAGTGLEAEAKLAGYLERWLADRRSTVQPSAPLSQEILEELRSLGYVDGG